MLAVAALLAVGCKEKNSKTDATEKVTLEQKDYIGTYKGVYPAADCPGIDVTLSLCPDSVMLLHISYQEEPNGITDIKGTYSLDGFVVTLKGADDEIVPTKFRVEGEKLLALDDDGNERAGEDARLYDLDRKGGEVPTLPIETVYSNEKAGQLAVKNMKGLYEENYIAVTSDKFEGPKTQNFKFVEEGKDGAVYSNGEYTAVVKADNSIAFSKKGDKQPTIYNKVNNEEVISQEPATK